MSTGNHEQRIAELEKNLASLRMAFASLTVMLLQSIGFQQKASTNVMEMLLLADSKNESMFGLLAKTVPDEVVRSRFESILAQSFCKRDQLAAMLEEGKKLPSPMELLAAITSVQTPPVPPAAPPSAA